MLDLLKKNGTDIVVGSRLVKGGGQRGLGVIRKFISSVVRWPSRLLTDVKDTTSGFFMLKRSVIAGVDLNPMGYKICLEILAKGNYKRSAEVPIIFANRGEGRSKMKIKHYFEYLGHVTLLLKDTAFGKKRKKGI
jgi:dolichol-phosphate mannosyltransferase